MTRHEKSMIVRQMREDGRSYSAIMERLGATRTESYALARFDVRRLVHMECKDCGAKWSELKMPVNKAVFHRCARCATVLWAEAIAAKALAEQEV